MAKKIQLQDANGNVLHPLTLGECVTMDNGENLDTLMSKSQMFTPTITQDKSMFKVGTGVDVDYSTNVKDGVYESLVFKGKSLVNLWKKHDTHNQRNFTLYEDGFMETVPNVLYFDHIQKANTGMIKPNTKYLLIVEVVKNTLPVPISFQSDNRTYFYGNSGMMFGAGETGVVKKIITSISDLSTTRDDLRWGAYIQFAQNNVSESERGVVKIRQMLIEYQQGMENWDIPYFDGIGYAKMPILRNVGKNLFDMKYHSDPSNILVNSAYWSVPIQLKGDTKYSIGWTYANVLDKQVVMRVATCKWTSTTHSTYPYSLGQMFNKNITSSLIGKRETMSFTTPTSGLVYIHFYNTMLGTSISSFDYGTWYTYLLKDIQVEELSSPTPYEDHKTNILRTSEEIVLREVNGVQDTYNPLTGEYVQRIGEIVITSTVSKGIVVLENNIRVNIAMPSLNAGNGTTKANNTLSDKFYWSEANAKDVEGLRVNGNTFHWCISKDKLTSQDLQGVNSWLQSNPITVQYELAEPMTTIIKPSTMTPFAYQNGHVIVESGHEGQSLLPEIEYSVVTGRTGQVTQNTKVLRKQEQQIIGLEELLLTQVVQMEYERTLLQFDYELQMMMLG